MILCVSGERSFFVGAADSLRVVWLAVWLLSGGAMRVLFIAMIVAGLIGFLTMVWFVLAHWARPDRQGRRRAWPRGRFLGRCKNA
jgi:hypothetical protein